MEDLLRQILEWVSHNPGWTYATIFLIAMGESMAVIGVVVPGVVSLMGAGALIAAGAIRFWPAFAFASAGAIAGDGLSYWAGRHFDRHIRDLWPFSRYPGQLERGVEFFERYGGWSVAIGRFAGPGRAIIPLVAGMMRMPPRRFYFANITSAIAQTFTFFLPGMIFGASLKLAAEAALRLSILAVLLVASLWIIGSLAHRIYSLLAPHASAWVQGLLRWSDLHPGMGQVAHALADPDHPDARTLTALAFILVLAFLLLGAIAGMTVLGESDVAVNRYALGLGQSLRTPLGDRAMGGLARIGEPATILPMVAVVFFYLRWRGRLRHALYWLAAAGFAVLATPVLGGLLQVPRPNPGMQLILPWSFPSGAALLSTSVYGFLAVSMAQGLPERLRWLPYALASALIGAVAWTRIYLGTEWLTDVVASIALGLAWISALGLAFRRHSRFDRRAGALGAVAVSVLAASLAVQAWVPGVRSAARYNPAPKIERLSRAEWLAGGWRRLPSQRADLARRRRHPLFLQLAGEPTNLEKALAPSGWHPALILKWGNSLKLLSPSLPLAELPLIPQVHDGHHEALVLVKTGADGRLRALRLWATAFQLDDGRPLWVGNVSSLHKETVLNLIAFPATDPEGSELPREVRSELDAAAAGLPAGDELIRVPVPQNGDSPIEAPRAPSP